MNWFSDLEAEITYSLLIYPVELELCIITVPGATANEFVNSEFGLATIGEFSFMLWTA